MEPKAMITIVIKYQHGEIKITHTQTQGHNMETPNSERKI